MYEDDASVVSKPPKVPNEDDDDDCDNIRGKGVTFSKNKTGQMLSGYHTGHLDMNLYLSRQKYERTDRCAETPRVQD